MIKENRKISEEEVAVIRATINRAMVEPSDVTASKIEDLNVVSKCECGCASIEFEGDRFNDLPKPLADGIGKTPSGGEVGVIVWGRMGVITGLEVYDIGAGDSDLVLPVPDSIKPWEEKYTDNTPLEPSR